jgi:hypothetical protein
MSRRGETQGEDDIRDLDTGSDEDYDDKPNFPQFEDPIRMSSKSTGRRSRSSRGHEERRREPQEPQEPIQQQKSNAVKIILALSLLFLVIGIVAIVLVVGGIGASSEGYHNRVGSFMTENVYYPICERFLN